MATNQIRAWILGLAFVGLILGALTVSGYASTGAVALVMIATLLAIRTLAGLSIFRFGRDQRPVRAYARTRTNGVGRQIDPDAPGRARPRAPGCSADL